MRAAASRVKYLILYNLIHDMYLYENSFPHHILSFFLVAVNADAAVLIRPPNNLGLVGYWSMNEGTSTIAGDFSGKGNNGVLTSMAFPPNASSGWTNKGKQCGMI